MKLIIIFIIVLFALVSSSCPTSKKISCVAAMTGCGGTCICDIPVCECCALCLACVTATVSGCCDCLFPSWSGCTDTVLAERIATIFSAYNSTCVNMY